MRVETGFVRQVQNLISFERRHSSRIRLQVPVFLRGVDAAGSDFVELTKTLNISATGASIACSHMMRVDQTLNLTFPAPASGAAGTVPSETPPIQAHVRREEVAGDVRLLGLEFSHPLE